MIAPPIGKALTEDECARLFDVAKNRPEWKYACTAAILSVYCGMRTCEIKSLQWKDVGFSNRLIEIRRSKTPAGWRTPSLNDVCLNALRDLFESMATVGAAEPNHYVFPWHGRSQQLDPTRPMTSWRTAWRSIRKQAGLENIRFHDGRHTAITTLAENGTPDWVIQAQVGHVDPQMMKTYSHIRRKALDEAAAALQPRQLLPVDPVQTDSPLIG
jgi:integrase